MRAGFALAVSFTHEERCVLWGLAAFWGLLAVVAVYVLAGR